MMYAIELLAAHDIRRRGLELIAAQRTDGRRRIYISISAVHRAGTPEREGRGCVRRARGGERDDHVAAADGDAADGNHWRKQ